MDHVVPLARGGDHLYSNVAVSHPLCNRRKGAKVA
jgi:5-methylcytosine-specific restriction endonuclease McrA